MHVSRRHVAPSDVEAGEVVIEAAGGRSSGSGSSACRSRSRSSGGGRSRGRRSRCRSGGGARLRVRHQGRHQRRGAGGEEAVGSPALALGEGLAPAETLVHGMVLGGGGTSGSHTSASAAATHVGHPIGELLEEGERRVCSRRERATPREGKWDDAPPPAAAT